MDKRTRETEQDFKLEQNAVDLSHGVKAEESEDVDHLKMAVV